MLNVHNIQNRLLAILRDSAASNSYKGAYRDVNEHCEWCNNMNWDSKYESKAVYLTRQKKRNEGVALQIARECDDLMIYHSAGGPMAYYEPWCSYSDYIVMPIRVGDLHCKVTVITLFPVKICYFQHSRRTETGTQFFNFLVEGDDYATIVREMADKIGAVYA